MGLAGDGDGNVLSMAGSVTSVDDDFQGNIIVNINGAFSISGRKVDWIIVDVNNKKISDNGPAGLFINASGGWYGTGGIPDHYISSGAGDDQIGRSSQNDFIRCGTGNDSINSGFGNDVVNGGPGSEHVTLGRGSDVYYLTENDLIVSSTDTITDFDSQVQIQIDPSIKDKISFGGVGTKELAIQYKSNIYPAPTTDQHCFTWRCN